ncbi:MAG: hypothetical protein K0B08_00825 [Bacteroidales bacterium]|nr:hypothetical protein [Bacteroidales bacterium]
MSLQAKFILSVFLVVLVTLVTLGQNRQDALQQFISGEEGAYVDSLHELTIYVIPSVVKYKWDSPRSLYRSYFRNIKRSLFNNHRYLLGHAFIELRSPLIPGKLLTGMSASSRQEQRQNVLKEYYGMAILGAVLQGRLETMEELREKKEKYARRGDLAFIRVWVNEAAAARILDYFDAYHSIFGNDTPGLPSYGGAFWPRYEGEGAGCSAFAVSFFDIAGVLRQYFDEWKIEIGIPMEIIGGPYNDYHKVRIRDVKRYKSWSDGNGETHITYEPFEIYDPTLMFEWIHNTWNIYRQLDNPAIRPVIENDVYGLIFDARDIPVPENEELFFERPDRSVFIDYYRREYIEDSENH